MNLSAVFVLLFLFGFLAVIARRRRISQSRGRRFVEKEGMSHQDLHVVFPSMTVPDMTIVMISDTHNLHGALDMQQLSRADLLVVSGDITSQGSVEEVKNFARWLKETPGLPPASHIVVIAGNHDSLQTGALLGDSCVYLENSGVTIDGIRIWGSPFTPFLSVSLRKHAAFQRDQPQLDQVWELMDPNVDFLVTHGPPLGILDKSLFGAGDEALSRKLRTVKPRVHQFGHIHKQYGSRRVDGTLYINASSQKGRKGLVNPPVVVVASNH